MSRRIWALLGFVLLLSAGGIALTQTGKGNAVEDSVKETFRAYTEAFNKGDLATVVAFWDADGEQVDEDGAVIRGRAAIQDALKDICKPNSGNVLKGTVNGVKIVGGAVALVDGTMELSTADGSDASAFEAVLVYNAEAKKWLFSRVRDLPLAADDGFAASYTHLRGLEWLVGDWTSTEGENALTLTAFWAKNRSHLVIKQAIKAKDAEILAIDMIISYDPVSDSIRSWVFDSNGGRGEADWTRQGNLWAVDAEGVTIEGKAASSKVAWKFIDQNTFEWSSTDRKLDDQPRPDIKLTYKRVGKK